MVIFATIFGAGFAVLLISLIFGGDADTHVDFDHGDIGHGPSIFSFRILALLAIGFGAVGFGCQATTEMTMFQSSMAGIGGALVMGVIGYFILRAFYASQATSIVDDADIIGQRANVIDAISASDYGQVACIIGGREFTFLARSATGKPIARNAPVRITSKSGNVVTVSPEQ